MYSMLRFVIFALHDGKSVLLHCWQGKHRSGVVCILVLALLTGWSWDEAERFYLQQRGLTRSYDTYKVHDIGRNQHDMPGFLGRLRREGFLADHIARIRRGRDPIPYPIAAPKVKPPRAGVAAGSGVPGFSLSRSSSASASSSTTSAVGSGVPVKAAAPKQPEVQPKRTAPRQMINRLIDCIRRNA